MNFAHFGNTVCLKYGMFDSCQSSLFGLSYSPKNDYGGFTEGCGLFSLFDHEVTF